MGDRCELTIAYPRSKEKVVLQGLRLDPHDSGCPLDGHPAIHVLTLDQVNYGLAMDRGNLANRGVVFLGHHGAGYSYDGALFASNGKACFDQDVTIDGYPSIALTWEADLMMFTPHLSELANANDFAQAVLHAQRVLFKSKSIPAEFDFLSPTK